MLPFFRVSSELLDKKNTFNVRVVQHGTEEAHLIEARLLLVSPIQSCGVVKMCPGTQYLLVQYRMHIIVYILLTFQGQY
jgi:hypothetical protein